ncbi:Odorant receptor 94b [Culex quinquefasciatus]|uniref:Odorant receptor n=1 Tax=Culex quinquefasciatus TaxID=7176 RepID=B0X046_CULQU|nr:Odorant receptor 94b [Culex quinquefasciatus]|eukprot:XP_001863018.1 Odorant receptor 94b [Culex quinquefasciatus]
MEFVKRYFVRHRNLWSSEFKNPKALYESASESAMRLADICGAEIFRQNYTRKNGRLALLYADFTLYLVLSFWCITVLWGQLLDVMFCVVMIGGAVQAFAKIHSYTNPTIHELQMCNLENFQNVRKYDEFEEAMWNAATFCKFAVIFYAIFAKIMIGLIVAYSIVSSLVGEHYVLPFGYFFPWIDRDTLAGYLINFAYQSTLLVYGYCGLQASDLVFIFFIIHAIARLEIIIVYLKKLDLLTQSPELERNGSVINELLDDIIEKHIQHTGNLSDLDDVLQNGIYVNFGSLVAQTVFSCYILVTADEIWYTGSAVAFGSALQLFSACLMGTLLSSKNDQLIREIYDISWNNLPIEAQKSLQLLLHSAQQPMVLSDGFNAVDLFYFVTIYKQIYSFVAMLLNFN